MPNYSNVNEGRAAANAAHSAWWKLYTTQPNSEETKLAQEHSAAIRADVIAKFGKPHPKYPDCQSCLSQSIFGGPDHEASPRCRSGRHAHCTCDTCF